jgi:hypothetical protein
MTASASDTAPMRLNWWLLLFQNHGLEGHGPLGKRPVIYKDYRSWLWHPMLPPTHWIETKAACRFWSMCTVPSFAIKGRCPEFGAYRMRTADPLRLPGCRLFLTYRTAERPWRWTRIRSGCRSNLSHTTAALWSP